MQQMTGMDAAFLYFETPTMHMHVVGVLVLDGSGLPHGIDVEGIRTALAQRIHLIAPLRRRVVVPPGGTGHPVWIEDPDFELSDHVSRAPLGTPVTWTDLERFVGDVAGRPLDRRRPLWEMWVVEGLDDRTVALVTKLHHSMMDGGAGGDLMASLFDLTPAVGEVPPEPTPWRPDKIPSPPLLAARSVMSLPRSLWEAPRAMAQTAGGLVDTARTWMEQRAAGTSAPLTAPRTSLNGAITPNRSVSLTRVDLDEVREIRRAFGTTINDVVLAATATALRAYFTARQAPVARPLIAAVPVNVRAEGPDNGGTELGNRVSTMMVPLPLEPDDPVERLQAVHARAVASKALHSAFGPQSLENLVGFLPPTVAKTAARLYCGLKLARLHPPVFNLIVSNVPGPPIDLYCAGARVAGIFPMGPVMEGTALNLTVLSEANHLNVGIMACPELVPCVGEVGRGFVEAIRELAVRARSVSFRDHSASAATGAGRDGDLGP
ncbi:MAG TPA: wax ester/triacylglycerol synthase family O-acyltransferase [Acidimicrobiales bacterium]|nr:wax ester/triacylglycerol synthase family O-acyltransferase [Acidimicrobiales bacterium]